jgi:prepilin-type N-terminal cleavage/methylation domain-containing protein
MNRFPLSGSKVDRAFTLIELLVVVSIISVLAALLMPAINSALNSAKKTTAKNQAVQIATAITAYEAEYGRLPAFASSNMGPANVAMLCTSGDASNNPRGIIFLEVTAWKKGKGGTNENGLCDPFDATNVYSVALDTGYSNSITVPSSTNPMTAGTVLTKHVGVWSTPKIGNTNVLINSWD